MPKIPRLSESVIYLRLAHNPELGYRKLSIAPDEESLSRILADSLTNGFEISRIVVAGEELYRDDRDLKQSIWAKFRKALGIRGVQ